MKQLGVENGARARYIWEEVQQLETPEAKKEYILNLYNKKIRQISKSTNIQINMLIIK